MKTKLILTNVLFSLCILVVGCSDDDGDTKSTEGVLQSVTNLNATNTGVQNQILLSWKNPESEFLKAVEIVCQTRAGLDKQTLVVDVQPGTELSQLIEVPRYYIYMLTVTAISTSGKRSNAVTVDGTPYKGEDSILSDFFVQADIIMTSMLDHILTSPRSGVWNNQFPNTNGPYWEGDATVWGQGGAFSGFVALREVAMQEPDYEDKYKKLDDLLYDGINKFITNDDGIRGYAVYPAEGNERFYDDNVWIGLDMIDLYNQTGNTRYLEKAEMVWTLLRKGHDSELGGGIYWRERPQNDSKNTCSTAPAAVLGAKLYKATHESVYLEEALQLYHWVKEKLQDPSDYLYWDNINLRGEIETPKFTYNSGQPMQAAVLLYQITGDRQYLTDAQNVAKSAFKHWFKTYSSPVLQETIHYVDGHTWFNAIMLRGFIELYNVDGDRTYITAYEKMLTNLWFSERGLNKTYNLLCYDDMTGVKSQDSWEVIHLGACVEMLARLAVLEKSK